MLHTQTNTRPLFFFQQYFGTFYLTLDFITSY
jgi:hypothetical protein